MKALADSAAIEIAVYPVITGKEKLKRFIKRSLLRQKLAPIDPFSWPNAMLGEGLLAFYEVSGDCKYLEAVAGHLKRWKKAGYPIHYVDNVMNGSLALWIEELISNRQISGKACAGGIKAPDADGIEEMLVLCRETESVCAEWLQRALRTEQGILPYRTHHPDWLFSDTLGMACPFLCRYGAEKQDDELLALGVAQMTQFLEKGMDQRTGLPYHGYEESTGMKCGIIGWGRACGWMMKGMAESLPYIPKKCGEYGRLAEAFWRLADTVGTYQRPDGGFSWQMEALEGHRDSSAEGMIGTAVVRGMIAGMPESVNSAGEAKASDVHIRRLERLGGILQQSLSEGTVRDCSGECTGFAEYSQDYGSYPWGTGSVLEFLALSENLFV